MEFADISADSEVREMDLEARAVAACAEYERWAAVMQRLTKEIGQCRCPKEEGLDADGVDSYGASCFAEARTETTDADNWAGIRDRRLNLDEIEEEVADCPACVRLCGLLRERKAARWEFGMAKRRVRAVGKRIIKSQDPHDALP